MQSLKPVGLPPESFRIVAMNCIISIGVENAEWRDGEMQSTPSGTPRVAAISALTLAPGSTPPWPGLAPWLSLSSTILICSLLAIVREFLGAERAVGIAAAEIARADFPDDVAAVFAVIGAVAAFAGIVGEIAFLGADVERADGVRAERAETHRRNIEDRGRIGLAAIRPADADAERLPDHRLRRHRMVEPLVACRHRRRSACRTAACPRLSWRADRRARACRGRTACRPFRSRENTAGSPGGSLRG